MKNPHQISKTTKEIFIFDDKYYVKQSNYKRADENYDC